MNQIVRMGLALTAACLLASCSKTKGAGRYALDAEHFAETVTEVLVDQGKIPPGAEDRAQALLRSAVFNLELKEDHTFTAEQKVANERHSYSGTWSLVGTAFHLEQTHEDGREKSDRMAGKLVGDTMTVTHTEKGVQITMRLNRLQDAASPR